MWGAHEERHPHISAEIKKKLKGTFDEEFEVLRECVHPVTGIV